MSIGILGKKVGMTSVFAPDGNYIPVTVIEAGPCVVTQVKTEEVDGYNALQLGFGEKKLEKCNKPEAGHFAKSGQAGFVKVKEFAAVSPEEFEAGQTIGVDMFTVGEKIAVSGTTKGRGFAGTIKRHGFQRGPETHGSRNHRAPGSIGCSAWPGKVIKGKKMPGHMGVDKKTIKNLEIVDIRPEENIILVKGAVPGAKTGVLELYKVYAG